MKRFQFINKLKVCSFAQPATTFYRAFTTQVNSNQSAVPLGGQSSTEEFDVYFPPHDMFDNNPIKQKGVIKTRGQVHASGDWHRSVSLTLTSNISLSSHPPSTLYMLMKPCVHDDVYLDPSVGS